MKRIGGAFAVVAALTLAACGEPADDRIPGPRILEEGEFDVVATVTLDGSGFDKSDVEIAPGQVVVGALQQFAIREGYR